MAGKWTESGACSALCQLILDDRVGGCLHRRRPALPPALYREHVAPFLRFEAPLPNMLYAFGGRNRPRGPVDTVEMLDTWHGTWVPCERMPHRRAGSAAAPLPDGRLIVVGGYNERGIVEGLLASCDVYDPFRECWEEDGAAPLVRARWGHGCALLRGQVYAVGGCSLQPGARPREAHMETLRSCEVYCSEKDKWEPCSPLNVPRSGSRAVNLGERYLAAVGGCDDVFGRAETQATVELYDPVAGCWSLLSTRLAVPRTSAAVVALDSDRFFVAGGAPSQASVEVCRVALPDAARALPAEARGPMAVALPEADSDVAPLVDAARVAQAEEEAKLEDLPEGRMGCQAVMVPLCCGDGARRSERQCILVVGGERSEEAGEMQSLPRVRQLASVAAYDVATGSWLEDDKVVSMGVPRTTMALCTGLGRVSVARMKPLAEGSD